MLTISNVSKIYQQGAKSIPILSDINLHVDKAHTTAIMGRSGSGKSTLLSLISGILKLDQGEIALAGKNYSELNENQLSDLRASSIGFVFQNFHLVSYLNALENVMLPAKVCGIKEAKEKAVHLLNQVGLSHRMDHLPGQLSGGEKQRVAIARSLIHNPSLILADEPSGSLDEQTGEEVMDILFDLVQQNETSLVLVTHDRAVAARCEDLYVIEDGKLRKT